MTPKPKENTERINVFFNAEMLERLKEEAQAKGMTVSGLVRMIVYEYFRNNKTL